MFTYPFAYTPSPEVIRQARLLEERIDADEALRSVFAPGKMLGVLLTSGGVLHAFSGKGSLEGFAPPLLDTGGVCGFSPEESARLQMDIFERTKVLNACGQERSIADIFAGRNQVPPSGTGDCAAPKLLQEAYRRGLKPIAMGEFWYGASPSGGEVREHGRFYPSCIGKCGPLLTYMLQGLDVEPNPLRVRIPSEEVGIIYEDDAMIVALKPSGMLCVPGKTGEKSLMELLPGPVYEVHRLDMDTSGLIVYAKTPQAQVALRQQFASREVSKIYNARLAPGRKRWDEGFSGTIALPLGPDWYDRPRQMVDRLNGKQAITRFTILKVFPDTSMDVRFEPLTGRTHQLRVHAASTEGLGHPIQGDRLYGAPDSGRLMLHAAALGFNHPLTGLPLRFED